MIQTFSNIAHYFNYIYIYIEEEEEDDEEAGEGLRLSLEYFPCYLQLRVCCRHFPTQLTVQSRLNVGQNINLLNYSLP